MSEQALAADLRRYFRTTQAERSTPHEDKTAHAMADAIEEATGEGIGDLMCDSTLWPIKLYGLADLIMRRTPRLPVGTPIWNAAQRRALSEEAK